jgi:hypothetical protein
MVADWITAIAVIGAIAATAGIAAGVAMGFLLWHSKAR